MKFKKILIFASCLIILVIIAFILNMRYKWINTDIIETRSIKSFDNVISAMSNNLIKDDENGIYVLRSPDNEAQLIWSKDYTNNNSYNLMMNFNIKPFMDAGLDVNKLNGLEGIELIGNSILIGSKFEKKDFDFKSNLNEIESFEQIIYTKRDNLNYHSSLDHFGINISNANAFEWAQNMDKNDKDIVFALNPEVFIEAGVNPNNISGWTYANIEMMDSNGKTMEVMKLLKPFNIK